MQLSEATMRKDELIKHARAVRRAENKVAKNILILLDDTRTNIIKELAANPSEWRAAYLDTLLSKVDEQINKFNQDATKEISVSQKRAIELGEKQAKLGSVPSPAVMKMVGIDPEILKVLTQYHASLVQGVSNDVKSKVTEIIRRAMMTGKSALQVQKELGSAVKQKGAFKTLGARAETIYRTEFGRVLENAAQASMMDDAKEIPGLKKRWITTFRNSRESHMRAHGQIVDVNEPFKVGGESLMYPGDPAGSAGNTINCRCASVPVVQNADGSYDDAPSIDYMIAKDNSPLANRPKGNK